MVTLLIFLVITIVVRFMSNTLSIFYLSRCKITATQPRPILPYALQPLNSKNNYNQTLCKKRTPSNENPPDEVRFLFL